MFELNTFLSKIIDKLKPLNQFAPLHSRFLHGDLLYLIETLLGVFFGMFYVAMNFCGKKSKSVEVLEKNVRTFYLIRQVMSAFYVW